MLKLRPEFMHRADPVLLSERQDSGNDSDSAAEEGGLLTLEMRDNPFASLMRKLDRLLDRDPAEAFRLARIALAERVFDGKLEDRLRQRMVEIVDTLHKNGFSTDLSGPFTKSVLNLTHADQPLPPAFAPPALTFALPEFVDNCGFAH